MNHIKVPFAGLLVMVSVNCFGWMKQNIEFKDLESHDSEPDYWTVEKMRAAKPLVLPAVKLNPQKPLPENVQRRQVIIGEGRPPEEKNSFNGHNIKYSTKFLKKTDLPIYPSDKGTSMHHYTSSRLVPESANVSWPYSTVGKLFFTIPGKGDFYCSASVINYRVVLTAGHCVHDGSGSKDGYYTNLSFVPAYHDGEAPFLSWRGNYVATTAAWFNSGGMLPNSADYAMIEVKDRNSATPRRLGSDTGFLGFQIDSLRVNHAHILAYPKNIDNGEQMHQVTSKYVGGIPPNVAMYASDMREGSDGGPYIQNFGEASLGQTGGSNPGRNRVIGIASYYYSDTSFRIQISSIPDDRFVNLLNKLCAHREGNCA